MSDDGTEQVTIRPQLVVAIVAAIAAAVFLPAIAGGWIYDDHPLIANNPYCHSFAWWPRWFNRDFWSVNEEILQFGRRVVYWRPAVTTTYALDWQLGGGAPLMFHLTNTLLHAGVAVLSFSVLRRWIGALWPAAIAALLFAVHPTKAESVAWIAGRTDELCMLSVLVATIGIGRRLRGERGGLAIEIGGTVAAYLCKEQAIVLPMFAVVECWVVANRPGIDLGFLKQAIRRAWPQATLAVAYLTIRGLVLPIRGGGAAHLNPLDHLLAVFETLGRFFTLTFAPHGLSIQQGLIEAESGTLLHSLPYIAIGTTGLALLVGLALVARRRQPILTIGIGFFLLTLAPTSNLVFTGMPTLVSERFLYLPVFGVALAAGGLLAHAPGAWKRAAYGAAVAAVLVLSLIATRRASDYADEDVFWNRELELHPDSREARQYWITKATIDKRYETALIGLMDLAQTTGHHEGILLTGVDLGYQVADVLARTVPDHDTAALRAIDQFCATVLDGKAEFAELSIRNVHLRIGLGSKVYAQQLIPFAAQYWALRATLQTRLGDRVAARADVDHAKVYCGDCALVVTVDALVLATEDRFGAGLAALDRIPAHRADPRFVAMRQHLRAAMQFRDRSLSATGPAQLQQRASELAALELWGAAYDVLAPYKPQIEQVPSFALGFAELAFRAGEPAIAREVLARNVAPSQIEPQLDDWSAKMGWRR